MSLSLSLSIRLSAGASHSGGAHSAPPNPLGGLGGRTFGEGEEGGEGMRGEGVGGIGTLPPGTGREGKGMEGRMGWDVREGEGKEG